MSNYNSSMNAAQKQSGDIMRALDGRCITQFDGPNGALMEMYQVGGHLVLIQIWDKGNGWEYYLQGKTSKVSEIAEAIENYFSTTR